MQQDQTTTKVVGQLQEILKGRYGRGLQIVNLAHFSNRAEEFQVQERGQEIHIPLKHDDLFLGKAILKGEGTIADNQLESMVDMVKLTLEPVLYREYLIRLENNQSVGPSRYDIRPGFLKLISSENTASVSASSWPLDEEYFDNSSRLTHSMITIESDHEDFAQRVAHDIHEQSGLWSFVQLKDLRASVQTLSELNDLTQITIYVEAKDLASAEVVEWIKSLENQPSAERLILIHKKTATAALCESFVVTADRLPVHRLLRIESLQMMLRRSHQA